MLLLLSLLATPAQATKARTVVVEALDASGQPLPNAAVVLDDEENRHVVNHVTGRWQSQVSYRLDGTVMPFTTGSKVTGWVVAAGFEPTRFVVSVRGRVSKKKVTLSRMMLDPNAVKLPQGDDARQVRDALTAASRALTESDARKLKARLNEADEGRHALQGAAYVQASVAVLELRTLAALNAWDERQQLALVSPTDEVARAEEISRDLTGDMALRWLAYAREAGQPTDRASAVCLLATGRPSRCD